MSGDLNDRNALSALPGVSLNGSLWFEPVGGAMELRLAVSSTDMPPVAVRLGDTLMVFEPLARVRGQSVYRAVSEHSERARSLLPQAVWLTPSGLRQEETEGSPAGGISHA